MILITGATGMLGAHIALELLRAGRQVRGLVRSGSSRANAESLFQFYGASNLYAQLEWVEGDVLEPHTLDQAFQDTTAVVHAAGFISFDPADRDLLWQVNGEGTANMINAALQAQVKFFCHISSVATLGAPNAQGLIDEDSWWKNEPGQSDYAISKYNAEREVWRGMEEGLAVMVLNPAVILGPGDPSRGSNTLFAIAKKGLKWYTEGSTGYVDARDVAKIVEQLFDHPIRNERFVVSADNLRFREIMDQLLTTFGHPITTLCARPWMLSIAWRLERIAQMITGRKPIITNAIARSAWQNKHYDGQRLANRLSFTYTPIHQTISDASLWYKSEFLNKP